MPGGERTVLSLGGLGRRDTDGTRGGRPGPQRWKRTVSRAGRRPKFRLVRMAKIVRRVSAYPLKAQNAPACLVRVYETILDATSGPA